MNTYKMIWSLFSAGFTFILNGLKHIIIRLQMMCHIVYMDFAFSTSYFIYHLFILLFYYIDNLLYAIIRIEEQSTRCIRLVRISNNIRFLSLIISTISFSSHTELVRFKNSCTGWNRRNGMKGQNTEKFAPNVLIYHAKSIVFHQNSLVFAFY